MFNRQIQSTNPQEKGIKNTRYKDVVVNDSLPQRKAAVKEFVVLLHLDEGVKVRIKSGSFNHSEALELVPDAILHVEENYGPVRFWSWEGEHGVLRTIQSAFSASATDTRDKSTLLGKISSFIYGEDIEEVERIRNKNARKAKLSSIKNSIKSFFEEDEEYYYVEEQPKLPLKQRIQAFFYEEVEVDEVEEKRKQLR